jgi:F-box-like
MSPRLPNEIWSMIFGYLPDNERTQSLCVSKAWRDILDATPKLWTCVHISHAHQFADPAGLSRRLEKSGMCLLDVFIRIPKHIQATDLHYAIEPLCEHVKRLRILDIKGHDGHISAICLKFLGHIRLPNHTSMSNPAPHLEALRVVSLQDYLPIFFGYAFDPAPRLRRLFVSDCTVPVASSQILKTVTSLSINEFDVSRYPDIPQMLITIATIPHLESFKYRGIHSCSIDFTRIVQVPRLVEADITIPGYGLEILRSFDAPRLTFVRLSGIRDLDDDDDELGWESSRVSTLLTHMSERMPCLRTLDICSVRFMDTGMFTSLLHQAEFRLEDLRVTDSPITDEAFLHLCSPSPHLRQLALRECTHITGGALIEYIRCGLTSSGWTSDFKLQISGCPGVSEDDLGLLSQLVEVGNWCFK